jgi:hypothetical protein
MTERGSMTFHPAMERSVRVADERCSCGWFPWFASLASRRPRHRGASTEDDMGQMMASGPTAALPAATLRAPAPAVPASW